MLKLDVFNVNKVLHTKKMSDQQVTVIILHRCHHFLLLPLTWRLSNLASSLRELHLSMCLYQAQQSKLDLAQREWQQKEICWSKTWFEVEVLIVIHD